MPHNAGYRQSDEKNTLFVAESRWALSDQEGIVAAGESAAREAGRQRDLADELARRAGIATQMARNFEAAARSESRLAKTLIELEPLGYTLMTDRRWPGSKHANVDLVLVGPGGVIIVDAKSWREVSIAGGRVYRDQADVTDDIARLADLVYATQRSLADIGLAAGEVRALAAFANPFVPRTTLFGVTMLSEAATVTEIARLGVRLTQQQVSQVRNALETLFLPMSSTPLDIDAATRPPVEAWELAAAGIQLPDAPEPEKLSSEQIRAALTEGLRRAPIEEWMAFLHPDQAHIVRRSFSGPSRIRGAAGTGKTVVALHRAAYLARTTGGRVLVTSYVRTLPKVMAALMERLAPDVVGQIDFRGVHAFARDILVERRGPIAIDAVQADRVFKDLWDRTGKDSDLGKIDPTPGYWQDELRYVLKGRGLTEFQQYAELARIGRRRALTVAQRALVWNLYHSYEAALHERGIFDWEDVILEAENSLEEYPITNYSAVVVDEAQDLSCAMIRMLHSLVGDRPDGLNLVGDGQQTIYPGGYTLAEAGVDISGRGVVLNTNYRNTVEITQFAAGLIVGDVAPDLEGASMLDEASTVFRTGVRPVYTVFPSRSVHDKSLVERVRRIVGEEGVNFGDIGVLALYTWHAKEALEALADAGIPTVQLEHYDGYSVDAVKVGTIKRSKGLEFKEVLVVRTPPHLVTPGVLDPDEAAAERRVLQRRELYVAMTRARDGLWVGVA
ncbi:hypothetical protein BH11ACT3_BH11ACT3_14010 [soil metagenome]